MKKQLRKDTIKKRLQLTADEIKNKSELISAKVIALDEFTDTSNVMLYVDFRNEVATNQLIQYVLEHKLRLILPRIDMKSRTMSLHIVDDLKDLELSSYGILEPPYHLQQVLYDEVDLIISPGVAFDRNCYRLGYGGGFYDQLLAKKRKEVPVIALAFDCQIVQQVPTEPHDIQVDYVVTESRLFKQSSE